MNTIRHPEKAHRSDNISPPRPDWIRVRVSASPEFKKTQEIVSGLRLNSVCEEAACPNISECWGRSHAAFMILGEICTRACSFCNVSTGKPNAPDPMEPENLAIAVQKMKLKHVVITSVDRDDLDDGGSGQFVRSIEAIRRASPSTTIEILTPDFLRKKPEVVEAIVAARPDIFNHNLETVPRLYPSIRPGARYFNSLRLLSDVKRLDPASFTKSGVMVGLGEGKSEIMQVMDDLRSADVDFLTIGQYLQPTLKHAAVDRYVTPEEFEEYRQIGLSKGFLLVASSPLTRSSYHADRDFEELKKARLRELDRSSD